MSVEIRKVKKESCPAARLIGKKYSGSPDWNEWWENNWFDLLERTPRLSFNGDAYLGAARIVNGAPERWIGMLFPAGTEVPQGFDFVEIEPLDYAVCYLYGREGSDDFYSMETHDRCLKKCKAMGLKRKEDHWCIERYNCPRFTKPDEAGGVILDYAISLQ